MTTLSIPSHLDPVSFAGYARKLAALLVIAALADWLFFRQPLGISIAVFLAALAVAAVAVNPFRAEATETLTAVAVLVAGLAPLAMGTSLLAACFGALATAYATITIASPERVGWLARIGRSCWLIIDGSWQGFADIGQTARRCSQSAIRVSSLAKWIVPFLLGLIFVVLFASANPLIEQWITYLSPGTFLTTLGVPRISFWLVVSLLIWPFIFIRGLSHFQRHVAHEFRLSVGHIKNDTAAWTSNSILNPAVVAPSLVIFNLLFAVQTTLDIIYLWGDVALPNGISYAEYAHRGAYPLLVTALLAAGFVMMTMRPGSDTEKSRPVRALVFLWTGQNVLLVVSSMLRLDLYVEMFSLTYLRVAAFIWMALVATGLMLIATRIALGRTNSWLVKMNFASLALVLYICCFVNFPRIIADYNLAHSREATGQGAWLDADYLASLGPQALPALDRHIERSPTVPVTLIRKRGGLAYRHESEMRNWRAWTYWDAEIARYLQESRNGTSWRQ